MPKIYSTNNRDNNFDMARILLAISILLVHSAGITNAENLNFILKYLNGDTVIKCFFAISGYLVTQSYEKNDITHFFYKRANRIFPAYYVAMCLMILVGVFLTNETITSFLFNSDTAKYTISNLVFLSFLHPSLPGIFVDNPLPVMNGSLWTIKSELILYLLTPVFVFLFSIKSKLSITLVYLLSSTWVYWFSYVHITPSSRTLSLQFVGMLSYYCLGAFLYLKRTKPSTINMMFILSLLICFICKDGVLSFLAEPIVITTGILSFCLLRKIINITDKFGDLSYGVYLYNFPVIQIVISMGIFNTHPYCAVAVSLAATLLVSYFSWTLIESPFLGRRLSRKNRD